MVIAVLPWLGRSVFCAGGHDVFKHSVECFKCCWDSSMSRVGRVDGAFLVCVVEGDKGGSHAGCSWPAHKVNQFAWQALFLALRLSGSCLVSPQTQHFEYGRMGQLGSQLYKLG